MNYDPAKQMVPDSFWPADVKNTKRPGYQSIEEAYKLISVLPYWAVDMIADGVEPYQMDRDMPPEWANRGLPTMQQVRAAKEFLSAGDKGTPKEISDRTDGPVAQKLEVGVKQFVLEAPPKAENVGEWEKLFGPAIDAETLPPAE